MRGVVKCGDLICGNMQSFIYIKFVYFDMLVENFNIVVMIEVRFSRIHVLTTGRLYHVASCS